MNNKELRERDGRLQKFWLQSEDHTNVAHMVRARAPEAFAEQRVLAIGAFVSAALAVLLREENPYYLSTATAISGGLLTVAGGLKIMADSLIKTQVEVLAARHPCRLKMILQQIRNQFSELIPETNELEREMFPEDIGEEELRLQ